MKQNLTPYLFLFSLAFLLSNCASLTGFQDGRTTGKNNGEFFGSLSLSQSPDFNDWEDRNDSTNIDIPNIYIPSLEFGGRYGVAEKVDITLRLNTNLNVGFGVKAQVVGDRTSKVALALGAEAGTFGLISGLWNFQIPLYLSVHPSENFGWYLTPRFIYQFNSYAGAEFGANYLGGNTGFLFGKRNKFGLDLGYYRLGADGQSVGLLQFGLGGRFAIGKN